MVELAKKAKSKVRQPVKEPSEEGEDEEYEEESVAEECTIQDILGIQLTREMIERWYYLSFFERTAIGKNRSMF
jgi:hypothetical protein